MDWNLQEGEPLKDYFNQTRYMEDLTEKLKLINYYHLYKTKHK